MHLTCDKTLLVSKSVLFLLATSQKSQKSTIKDFPVFLMQQPFSETQGVMRQRYSVDMLDDVRYEKIAEGRRWVRSSDP